MLEQNMCQSITKHAFGEDRLDHDHTSVLWIDGQVFEVEHLNELLQSSGQEVFILNVNQSQGLKSRIKSKSNRALNLKTNLVDRRKTDLTSNDGSWSEFRSEATPTEEGQEDEYTVRATRIPTW